MKIAIAIALLCSTASAATAQQRTFYGADGRVSGRAATDTQGTTTFYDAAGRKAGSVSQPPQQSPKGKSK